MLYNQNKVMEMSKKDARVTVCMTSEHKARLEAQAEKEGRSTANLVHKVIKDYLEKEETTPLE